MRQVESSDPESVRLAELIDAGKAAKMLGLHMPDGHGAGRIWLVGVSEFVLESFETQSVAVVIDGPPQRFRRRHVAPVFRLTDREWGATTRR